MKPESKIYVAGHRGLVGSAILKNLKEKGFTNLITRTHAELDLKDFNAVAAFFKEEKPEFVFLAAAKVGGIMANSIYRAQFIYENLQIQNNVIHQAYLNGVKKLLFLGSSCVYPKNAPQPMQEEYLLTSSLEYTNEPYALAKIAGMKMCEAYNFQYGTNFISVMPTNLFGPNDNFHLENSHVLPALIRKMHLSKLLEDGNFDAIRKDLELFSSINSSRSENSSRSANTLSQESTLRPENALGSGYDSRTENTLSTENASTPDNNLRADNASRPENTLRLENDSKHKNTLKPDSYSITDDHQSMINYLNKYGIVKDESLTENKVSLNIWGTGNPLREFLWSDDMADACVYIMTNLDYKDLITQRKYTENKASNTYTGPVTESRNAHNNTDFVKESRNANNIETDKEVRNTHNTSETNEEVRNTHINIGTGKEISIHDLAFMIKGIVGFKGNILFDSSKPDGTPRKLLDISKLTSLGWTPKMKLRDGIVELYKYYLQK